MEEDELKTLLKHIKDQQIEMETNIREAVLLAVAGFETHTGLQPFGISINMCDVTAMGMHRRKYAVGNVVSDISLETF